MCPIAEDTEEEEISEDDATKINDQEDDTSVTDGGDDLVAGQCFETTDCILRAKGLQHLTLSEETEEEDEAEILEELTPLENLMKYCHQSRVGTWASAFGSRRVLEEAFKVGEGTFAEVYASTMPDGSPIALKVRATAGAVL